MWLKLHIKLMFMQLTKIIRNYAAKFILYIKMIKRANESAKKQENILI